MAPGAHAKPRRCRERRTRPVERFRLRGMGRENVEGRERDGRVLQLRNGGGELAEQPLVERLLARERALLRGERLVLERLELRSDVALGVLERLPAPVIVRNLGDVDVRDLDVEAVDAVELDLEAGDAGPRALPRLEIDQERAAVVLDRAKLVEL